MFKINDKTVETVGGTQYVLFMTGLADSPRAKKMMPGVSQRENGRRASARKQICECNIFSAGHFPASAC